MHLLRDPWRIIISKYIDINFVGIKMGEQFSKKHTDEIALTSA